MEKYFLHLLSITHTDLHYKILHYSIHTNEYTCKCNRDKANLTPYCDFCNITEDITHLCKRIKTIWTHYQPPKNNEQTIHTISTYPNDKLKW